MRGLLLFREVLLSLFRCFVIACSQTIQDPLFEVLRPEGAGSDVVYVLVLFLFVHRSGVIEVSNFTQVGL